MKTFKEYLENTSIEEAKGQSDLISKEKVEKALESLSQSVYETDQGAVVVRWDDVSKEMRWLLLKVPNPKI